MLAATHDFQLANVEKIFFPTNTFPVFVDFFSALFILFLLKSLVFLTLRRAQRLFYMQAKNFYARISVWRNRFISENYSLIMAALAVGIVTGCGAVFLKMLIAWVTIPLQHFVSFTGSNLWTIALPVVGFFIVTLYQKYILRQDIYHGVDRMSDRLRDHNYIYSPRLILAPLFASSITLGFGGSAGSEGPIASSGAAIGSNVARIFGFSPQRMMVLIACGAGAGIAGIFKAPIGGALFIIELFTLSLDSIALIALFTATISSALTAYALSGLTPDIIFNRSAIMDMTNIMPVIVAGVAFGIYSTYYAAIMRRLGRFYAHISNPWIRALSSGLLVGVLVFLFPALYGEGYKSVTMLLDDMHGLIIHDTWPISTLGSDQSSSVTMLIFATLLLAVKPCATSSTVDGGAVAGDYAPLIMIGSVAGFVFAYGANLLFGFHLPVTTFVFLGMTGIMAGAIKAPLMATFLTVEMVATPSLLLPAAIVAFLSYLTRLLFNSAPHLDRLGHNRWHGIRDIYK